MLLISKVMQRKLSGITQQVSGSSEGGKKSRHWQFQGGKKRNQDTLMCDGTFQTVELYFSHLDISLPANIL